MANWQTPGDGLPANGAGALVQPALGQYLERLAAEIPFPAE